MLKKYLSLTLVVLLANLTGAASAFARSETIKEAQAAVKHARDHLFDNFGVR